MVHGCWIVWKERCAAVIQKKVPDPVLTIQRIQGAVAEKLGKLEYEGDSGKCKKEIQPLAGPNQRQGGNR